MKQSLKQSLLTMLVALVSLTASAYDFEVDGLKYSFVISDGDTTCAVSQFNKCEGDIIIPSSVTYNERDYRVTEIENYAFQDCERLTSVKIPNSVTYIGSQAFFYCKSLNSIEIPNGVKTIEERTFSSCGLLSVEIPSSVTYIGDYAFVSCKNLSSVEIPNNVTYIGTYAFGGCDSLISIEIPNSVTHIGNYAFTGCDNLMSVKLSDCNINWIGYYTFYYCTSLTSIEIPNTVTGISEEAFSGCCSLTSINIPNSVTYIDDNAFKDCSSLTSAIIGNGLEKIGNEVFYGCTKLSKMSISNSYTMEVYLGLITDSIGAEKDGIKKLIIADDYIDDGIPTSSYDGHNFHYIFEKQALDTLICKTKEPPTIGPFSSSQYENLKVFVPTASLSQYKEANIWKDFLNLQGGAEEEAGINSIKIIGDAIKSMTIFDISGRKLKAPQKGLNIINGKKVVVK